MFGAGLAKGVWRSKRAGVLAATALGIACASPNDSDAPGTSPAPSVAVVENELVRSLVELGDAALDAGDFGAAAERYQRALAVEPRSSRARTGLGRVALRRGDRVTARGWLEGVVASDANAATARIALASVEEDAGNTERARRLLAEATATSPLDPAANAAYARVTGPAPREPAPEAAGVARALAGAHPYDLWAAVTWARLALAGDPAGRDASAALEAVSQRLWLADLDLESARAGIALLRQHRAEWAERRVVFVYSWADETLRRYAGWRMRLRGLWRGQNEAFVPLLQTLFLPAGTGGFDARGANATLASVNEAWMRDVGSWPAEGILAAFTERPGPRLRGYRLGVAELAGRRLVVRLSPGELDSRTLAHEMLHLYGAVHVRGEVDSLMNPSGDSSRLDRPNRRIATLQRDRRFRGRGFARDTFPFVDARALTDAYADLLRLNLAFRSLGLDRALEAAEASRYYGADLAREEVALDAHFGDVASFIADLLVYQERLIEAAFFYEGAARLYGSQTPRGQAMRQRFDLVYRALKARGELQ